MVDNFKMQRHNYPILDSDTTAYYICYATAGSVKLAGDFTNWSPSLSLNPVIGTDLWYYKGQYPRDGRIEYKFIIDGQWGLDALNPSKALGGFGANSELKMPAYRESDLLQAIRNVPKGLLSDHELYSNSCKELRYFKIYLPADYQESNKQYPVVIYHDGEDYLAYTGILTILDNLSFSPINLPLIAVFVKPVQRDPEYSGKRQEAYTAFIVNELMPYLEKNYRILSGPENHVISGISNGGNIALWISGKYPDIFGKVAVHSSNIEKSIFKLYKKEKFRLQGCIWISESMISLHYKPCTRVLPVCWPGKTSPMLKIPFPAGTAGMPGKTRWGRL